MRSTQVFTVLALLATSVSSMSTGHSSNQLAHRRHGAELTHNSVLQARGARRRNPGQEGVSKREETAPRRVRKRGINQRRCAARSSSSLPAAASPTSSVAATSATPTTSATPEPEPTTTSHVEPTTTSQEKPKEEPTTSKTSTKASKTSTAAKASPTADSGSGSSSGSNTGEGTFYATGLGACGITNVDTDFICAVSHSLFDGFEGYTGGDPNSNPICGRKIKATYQGKSVTVTVTDRCPGCAYGDLDFSPAAFDQLADQAVGRLTGMTWVFV